MLGVNSSLHVIGVGFQLYSQLKKSPHDSMGVLGSSAVSTASQTTRLGKGSSVTTWDKHASWRSYYSETYLEWILKYVIIISFGLLNCTLLFPLFPSSLFIFDHLPSAYLLAHNCEISRGSFTFPFVITLVLWSIAFDPHQHRTTWHRQREDRNNGSAYIYCHQATNRTDPQYWLSTTLDVPLHLLDSGLNHRKVDRRRERKRGCSLQPKKKKCILNLWFSFLPRSFANSMGKCLLQLYTLNPKHYHSTHSWPESSCHLIMILECTNCHHWITRCERKRHWVHEHEGRNNNIQCVQFLDDHSHEHYFPLRHPFPMTAPMLLGRHGQLPVRRKNLLQRRQGITSE